MFAAVEQQHALLLDVREKVVAALEVFVQVFDVLDNHRRTGPVKSEPTQMPADCPAQSGLAIHRGICTVLGHYQQVEIALIAVNNVVLDIMIVGPSPLALGAKENQHRQIVADQFADYVGDGGELPGYVLGSLGREVFIGILWNPVN